MIPRGNAPRDSCDCNFEHSAFDGEVVTVVGEPALRWLSIPHLIRTAHEIRRVTKYAKRQDPRGEFAAHPPEFYRLDDRTGDVRVDFVADTGDGFDATFATALSVAGHGELPTTEVREDGRRTADLLVLGGDLVYPVARKDRYKKRFTGVFEYAADLAEMGDGKPPVVALPGNHDWYDRLKAFSEMMFKSGEAEPTRNPSMVPIPAERKNVGGWGGFPVTQLLRGPAHRGMVAVGRGQPARRAD